MKMRTGKPLLPPTFLLMALILMLVLHWILPSIQLIPIPWNLGGLLLLGFGLWLSCAAEAQFRRARTPVSPLEKPGTLIRDGLYQFSRNPMYLGFVGLLVGVALLLGSLSAFLVIPGFVALMDLKFIRMEEAVLAESFPGEWHTYVQKVPRWI